MIVFYCLIFFVFLELKDQSMVRLKIRSSSMTKSVSSVSGFQEFLPSQQKIFEDWKQAIATHFSSYGFTPQETPVVERTAILTSKGNDHEIYGLYRLKDEGKTDMGLRFDLTVPLARYVVEHQADLIFPYRRYQMAPVWRGERPQKGRYRQFYQCDIDIIGKDTLAPSADGEVAGIMGQLLSKLPIGPFVFRLNHRAILMAWLQEAGLVDQAFAALRWLDKKDKIGWSAVLSELAKMGAKGEHLAHLEIWDQDPHAITPLNGSMEQGLQEMEKAVAVMRAMGMTEDQMRHDPLLARGLTYYSGMIYEAELVKHKALGTIGAGGRYAHLAQSLDPKSHFPGVGLSLGLSRLFSALPQALSGPKACLFITGKEETQEPALAFAHKVRQGGFICEVWLESDVDLSHQLRYGQRKGYSHVIFADKNQWAEGRIILKHMDSGVQRDGSLQEVLEALRAFEMRDGKEWQNIP